MVELQQRLEYIKKNLAHLNNLTNQNTTEKILQDYTLLTSALYTIQTSIQALIDISLRFLAEKGEKPPSTYKEIARRFTELDILAANEAELFRKIIGFRNVLVHQYLGLNFELLRDILEKKLFFDIYNIAFKIVKRAIEMNIDP